MEYWESLTLEGMTLAQREAICDGCGRCCLQKLEDSDTGNIYFTSISCRLLDITTCRCTNYADRFSEVPDCTAVFPLDEQKCSWLPESCAYRRLAEGRGLAAWHPLVSGSPESVHQAGVSVQNLATSEVDVDESEYPEFVISFHDLPG